MAEDEIQDSELPLETVGRRLAFARENAGMSLDDISARTKISKRHLVAIEEDRFADLAGRTYAVGFSRSYARTVGLDETEIAEAVREQLAAEEQSLWPGPQRESFEPGDPARVPPSRLAWMAGLGAVVVLLLLGVLWKSFLSPAAPLPDLIEEKQPVAGGMATPTAGPALAAEARDREVVFTALEPDIWVKFYDEDGNQLFQKQMDEGERYVLPDDARGPQIWTGRPDAFRITIDGREVPGLGDAPLNIKDVPVSAEALLARGKETGRARSGTGPDES